MQKFPTKSKLTYKQVQKIIDEQIAYIESSKKNVIEDEAQTPSEFPHKKFRICNKLKIFLKKSFYKYRGKLIKSNHEGKN